MKPSVLLLLAVLLVSGCASLPPQRSMTIGQQTGLRRPNDLGLIVDPHVWACTRDRFCDICTNISRQVQALEYATDREFATEKPAHVQRFLPGATVSLCYPGARLVAWHF